MDALRRLYRQLFYCSRGEHVMEPITLNFIMQGIPVAKCKAKSCVHCGRFE